MNYNNHINLAKNQLQNAVLQPLGSAPSSPVTGQMYYDSGSNKQPLWYDGTSAWTNNATHLGGQAGSYYLSRTNHTGSQLAATISDLAATVQAYRLDQFAAPTAAISLNSQKITNLATPTAATDAATKGYVDGVATGLDFKASVRAASTANLAGVTYNATGGTSARGQITTAPNTLDSVSLALNDRILLKSQTTGAQNGIWVVTTLGTGANGVWDRATDFDTDAEVTSGAFTFVEEGTANGDTGWVLTTNNPITIGGGSGTSLVFAQFSSAGAYTAGNGLQLVGSAFSILLDTNSGLSVSGTGLKIDTAVTARRGSSLLTGSTTSYTVAHGMGTASLAAVTLQLVSTGAIEYADISVDATNITVAFATAPTSNAYRVNWVA